MKAIRFMLFAAEAVGCYLLQTSPSAMPVLFGERPELLAPAALTVSVYEDEGFSVLAGALCGALADCAAGCCRGFYGIALSAACYIVSSLFRDRLRKNMLTVFAVAGAACVFITALSFLFFYVIPGCPEPLYSFTAHCLPGIACTLAVIPVFCRLNGQVRKSPGEYRILNGEVGRW